MHTDSDHKTRNASVCDSRVTWTDRNGKTWTSQNPRRPLTFRIKGDSALRAEVFFRDGFKCRYCGAIATNAPTDYDGRYGLPTVTLNGAGQQDQLVVDHVLTRRFGGLNVPENLQTLCETCNRRKIKRDNAAGLGAESS